MVSWLFGSVLIGVFIDMKVFEGCVVCISLLCGELVIELKFVLVGMKGGLFVVIVDGSCVIMVCVNDVVGVVGFVLLGNYVDVIVNM